MVNKNIGLIKCSECDCSEVPVREANTAKSFAYSICPECGNQSFCRSVLCDEKLRARMRPVDAPIATETPAPKPEEKENKDGWNFD